MHGLAGFGCNVAISFLSNVHLYGFVETLCKTLGFMEIRVNTPPPLCLW